MIRGVSSHLELCHYNTIKTQYSVGNAFNVNTNSSNCMSNNNNKYNTNNVRAVCDYQDNEDFILFFVNMLVAYYECRRNKRHSISEILYEMNGVMNTLDLAYDVYVYQYKVGPSICFLIYIPTIREVFAASFADRCFKKYKGEVYFGRSYHKMITKKKTKKKRKYKIKGLQVYYANKI